MKTPKPSPAPNYIDESSLGVSMDDIGALRGYTAADGDLRITVMMTDEADNRGILHFRDSDGRYGSCPIPRVDLMFPLNIIAFEALLILQGSQGGFPYTPVVRKWLEQAGMLAQDAKIHSGIVRDPRIDPRSGDALRKGNWTRRVMSTAPSVGWPNPVHYERIHIRTKNREIRRCDTREGWHRWARTAAVLTVAQDAPQ